jgi:PAS domain S-box-containing protein
MSASPRQYDVEIERLRRRIVELEAEVKLAQEALRDSEANARMIVDAVPGLVATLSPSGEVETVNGRLVHYFGQTLEELRNWSTNETIHADDLAHVIEVFATSIKSGTPYEISQRMRRFDGEYRWLENRGFPIRGADGSILRWCVLLTDIEESKRAEDSLYESDQLFKTIFDEAGTGITLVDLVGREPIRNNRALQKMLKCSEAELGQFETYDRLTFEGNRDKDANDFLELCEGIRDSLNIEKHFVLKNGESIWANAIFTLLRDEAGRPRYVITIHEDITQRKLALERLQANQELLDLAQKSAGATAFDWYTQQEINHWSPEQEGLFGLAPGTFDGRYKTFKKMLYQPDWPILLDAIHHAHRTGEVSAEYRVVWPDGSLHWLSTNGRMFFDDAGEPLRMVGFTSDVTRRKTAEEALRRSEAFLTEGQYLARMGNFSWRVNSNEITWSEQMYRIFEFEPGTSITVERIASRVHPDDVPLIYEMAISAQRGVSDFEYEHRLLMPDRSVKVLHLIAHLNRHERDELEYLGAVQDVTQRRLDEEALSEARSELARAARAMSLGVLTAAIAHEVNQPLSGIVTNASTCVRMLDAEPPNVDGALETARRTIRDGNRASDVISRLRALFGRKDFVIERIDLNETAQEVIALSRNELQRSQVALQTNFALNLPLVNADRIQIQQVILNLLLNATDAMSDLNDKPRDLIVSTKDDVPSQVTLSVQDVGIGFVSTEAQKLFDAFYTTKKSGMGIGLSVSRSIIEAHKGRLWAESNKGTGAIFTFSLPIPGRSDVSHSGETRANLTNVRFP